MESRHSTRKTGHNEEIIVREISRLRTELEKFLIGMTRKLDNRRAENIYLINNYDAILEILKKTVSQSVDYAHIEDLLCKW